MKKIILILLLIIGLSGCDKVDQTNVNKIDYSLILEAKDRFKNDSTINTTIIQKEDMNYVFEKGKDYPILSSYNDYRTDLAAIAGLTFLATALTLLLFSAD